MKFLLEIFRCKYIVKMMMYFYLTHPNLSSPREAESEGNKKSVIAAIPAVIIYISTAVTRSEREREAEVGSASHT